MAKKRKKVAKKRGSVRSAASKKTGRRGRPPGSASLQRVSTDVLMREVARRERQAGKLAEERERLLARIEEIDAELSALGDAPIAARTMRVSKKRGGKRGPRPKNSMTLEEAIVKTLNGKTMGVTEIAQAVLKSGYKTNAENFRTMVNQTLLRSDRIKKVARGKYTTA